MCVCVCVMALCELVLLWLEPLQAGLFEPYPITNRIKSQKNSCEQYENFELGFPMCATKKFGFGGRGKREKQNTRTSTDDFDRSVARKGTSGVLGAGVGRGRA